MDSKLAKFLQDTVGKTTYLKSALRHMFKGSYDKYQTSLLERKSKLFNDYGLEALSKFDECMCENNFRYTLAFGTMLGAIREKGFIKHDLDIDTYMWIEDYSPKLIKELNKAGFTWLYNYSIDNDKYGREDTFNYKGVNIDVFYIYPKIDKYPYCCDFVHEEKMKKHERLPRRIELPFSTKRKVVDFESIKLYVPENAEELCEFRYGSNFMIPDPSWDWINEKESIVEWRDKISETKYIKIPRL